MPSVSVVVPNYNHARYLPQRIESILRQTYQDFELILLDDCSTDDSRAVLSQCAGDARVRIEFNEANSGSVFKQWNKGVRLARGKYVWIAESDDYADEHLLERLVRILDRDDTVAYAYCRSWQITADGRRQGFHDKYSQYKGPRGWDADYCVDGRQECRDYFLFMTPVSNASAAVFRKSAYDSVGGADESMVLCGDGKLWAGIALTGRVAYISEPLNYYRLHADTQRMRTSRRSVGVIEGLQNVRWLLDRLDLSEAEIARVYRTRADQWVPALMSPRVPFHTKRRIFGYAKAIDPHPIRRFPRPAMETIRLSLLRRWRSFRHAQAPGAASRFVSSPTLQHCYAHIRRVPFVGDVAHGFVRRILPSGTRVRVTVRTGLAAGLSLLVDPRYEAQYAAGLHENTILERLAVHLCPGDTFYDVGAHIGFVTLIAARLVGFHGKVFAFEADPENSARTGDHAQMNSLPQIEVIRSGVWSECTELSFARAADASSRNTGAIAQPGENSDVGQVISIPAVTLDRFAEEHRAPNVIKIDVEGAEGAVLKGAEAVFREAKPILICEIHSARAWATVSQWLEERDYRWVWLSEDARFPRHLLAEARS